MTPIEVTPQPPDIDQRALRVFLKAIELVGGRVNLWNSAVSPGCQA